MINFHAKKITAVFQCSIIKWDALDISYATWQYNVLQWPNPIKTNKSKIE